MHPLQLSSNYVFLLEGENCGLEVRFPEDKLKNLSVVRTLGEATG